MVMDGDGDPGLMSEVDSGVLRSVLGHRVLRLPFPHRSGRTSSRMLARILREGRVGSFISP